jgi:hypothetical protein
MAGHAPGCPIESIAGNWLFSNVMAGLGPAIHDFTCIRNDLDAGPAVGIMM